MGLSLSALFLITAGTGLLLLWKKEFDALQPPTRTGSPAQWSEFLDLDELWQVIAKQEHPHFRSQSDIERIDVRPAKRVFKVRSIHEDAEMQVDASTGAILNVDARASDALERIHDGSWLGDGFKVFVMPLSALGLAYLVATGWWMWLRPRLRARARRIARRAKGVGQLP